jgi:hypothetical protein
MLPGCAVSAAQLPVQHCESAVHAAPVARHAVGAHAAAMFGVPVD